MSHKRAFEFFGGVPQLVVPDCLKSAVSVARNTDPDLNPTYQMLAAHFGTAIMPARPRKPKDKSKAEVGYRSSPAGSWRYCAMRPSIAWLSLTNGYPGY